MGLIPDMLIQLLLYVCFGVYLFMGLVLLIMGIVYSLDDGAVGSTGIYLIFIGLLMLIIGGIAIFANLKKFWVILLVIELVNVALFLVLFVLVVVVLMMATGTTDPIRTATEAAWDQTLPTLVGPKTDPNSDQAYCEAYGKGDDCARWYGNEADGAVARAPGSTCALGPDTLDWHLALNNCTAVGDEVGCAQADVNECAACVDQCKEAVIEDIKEEILPASYFVFVLCVFLMVAVVWNNILIGMDEIDGVAKIIGLVINGVIVLFSFVLIVMAIWNMSNASDACPKTVDSCIPTSLWLLLFVGLGLLGTGAVVAAGIQLKNGLLIRVGTLVMVFLSLICLLVGLVMGMSSGAVMDDMQYYYDSNYPRMRATLESVDNSFCKLKKLDCVEVARGTVNANNAIVPELDDEALDADDFDTDEEYQAIKMTSENLWNNMWSVASTTAANADTRADNPFLDHCLQTGICVSCGEFYDGIDTGGEYSLEWKETVVEEGANFDDLKITPANMEKSILRCSLQGTTTNTGDDACPPAESVNPASATTDDCAAMSATNCSSTACSNSTGTCAVKSPVPMATWTETIKNYTYNDGRHLAGVMSRCEVAIETYTKNTVNCPGADKVAAFDKYTYKADCTACVVDPSFSFVSSLGTNAESCLNYFVGHFDDHCGDDAGGNQCKHQFRGVDAVGDHPGVSDDQAEDNVAYMVGMAYEKDEKPDSGDAEDGEASNFCGYTDDACKAKIKVKIEGSMSVIGWVGLIFIIFFIAIMFLTLQGIKSYRRGDGGDEDDDDDDESDE